MEVDKRDEKNIGKVSFAFAKSLNEIGDVEQVYDRNDLSLEVTSTL